MCGNMKNTMRKHHVKFQSDTKKSSWRSKEKIWSDFFSVHKVYTFVDFLRFKYHILWAYNSGHESLLSAQQKSFRNFNTMGHSNWLEFILHILNIHNYRVHWDKRVLLLANIENMEVLNATYISNALFVYI